MKNLAIVAIPSIDDIVWRFSSEKVPHLTILYLGDQSDSLNTDRMEQFVGHVVNTSMHKFGLGVSYRGNLGDKDADVLFFDKEYMPRMLETSRSYFLSDPDIKRAYESTEQFPAWIPHLTMGYPESPAKPDEREYPGITWVNFDRIAFWTRDYEGPEFGLKNNYSEVSMSKLKHYGIKGMHWGQRKASTPQQRLKQIEKKKERFNGNKIVEGAELVGWAIRKGAKNPSRRAKRSVITRGALETAVILGGGSYALNKAALSPRARQGAQISGILLAGKVAQMRISQLTSINQFKNHSKLLDEEVEIKKNLRKSQPKGR